MYKEINNKIDLIITELVNGEYIIHTSELFDVLRFIMKEYPLSTQMSCRDAIEILERLKIK